MRRLLVLGAVAALGAAVLVGPARAASPGAPVMVNWDATTSSFTLSVFAGMSFAPEEELQILAEAGGQVRFTLADPGSHYLMTMSDAVSSCRYLVGQVSLQCSPPDATSRPGVQVNLTTATGETTTVVMDSAYQVPLDFRGGSGPDYVQGGTANDQIDGAGGADDLFGGPGDDKITGGDGADNIEGEEGNDSVGGGPGDDYVSGDTGLDSMTGGPGVDELDSKDGFPDTYVNCDNEPGKGAITFDAGLDIPYDCPVILPPTAPLNLEAAGGKDSITVSWKAPEFDGNSQDLTYDLFYRLPGQSENVAKPIVIDGTETSHTLADLKTPGLYSVSLRARNEEGVSALTTAVPVAVGDRPSPPQSITSVFARRWVASVSWVPPADDNGVKYQLALRVKDKKGKSWLAWQPLSDQTAGTSMNVGDDLRLVGGRLYQFRVRTVTGNGDTSDWINSAVRFAGDLAALTSPTLTDRGPVWVAVSAPGLAWRYNVTIAALTASMTVDSYQAMPIFVATVSGQRYSGRFPGPLLLRTGCWVGVNYRLPGSTVVERARVTLDCPS